MKIVIFDSTENYSPYHITMAMMKHLNQGLKAAKENADKVLYSKELQLEVPSSMDISEFVLELEKHGAIFRIED